MQSISFQNDWEKILNNTFQVFGVKIHRETLNSATDWVLDKALSSSRAKHTCHFVNADCLNTAFHHGAYRQTLNTVDRVFADGSGVRLACKIKQLPAPDNVNGTDFFPALCAAASQHKNQSLRIYLLGGKPGVAKAMIDNMSQQFPKVKFVGEHHGFFDNLDSESIIEHINASGANLLLVGMGAPLQEQWIQQFRDRIDCAVCMGVGGLFDYYSNNIPRAPFWMRKIGCEWVWRLLQEPKRLARRYLIGNFLFVFRVLREKRAESAQSSTQFNPALLVGSENSHSQTALLAKIHTGLQALRVKQRRYVQRLVKRSIDVIGASLGLILLSPVLLVTMLLIYLESPGRVFFSQQRIGKKGQSFKLWKFRSMHTNAEARLNDYLNENEMAGGVLFKMKKDPRITRVGQFIRKYSIDELPQLWNVLNGSMSLVGPRPALPQEVAQYQTKDRQRLHITPGITCIWQVSGRSDIPFEKQVELDHLYVSQRSIFTDIKLLFATIPAVLTARGAY